MRLPTSLTSCALALCLLVLGFCGSASAGPRAAQADAESRLLSKVNEARRAHGLHPLRPSPSLGRSAGRFALHLMRTDSFGHASRVRASPRFDVLGEALALHTGRRYRAGFVVRRWLGSGPHRAILLSPVMTHVGAGAVRGRLWGRRHVIWVLQAGAL